MYAFVAFVAFVLKASATARFLAMMTVKPMPRLSKRLKLSPSLSASVRLAVPVPEMCTTAKECSDNRSRSRSGKNSHDLSHRTLTTCHVYGGFVWCLKERPGNPANSISTTPLVNGLRFMLAPAGTLRHAACVAWLSPLVLAYRITVRGAGVESTNFPHSFSLRPCPTLLVRFPCAFYDR